MAFDGSRECINVRVNKHGNCQCWTYGPLGSARKTFHELCKEKQLSINIGKEGKRGKMKGVEYPPIEDMDLEDMWGGLDFPPVSFPLTRDALVAAGAGTAGMLLSGWALNNATVKKSITTPTWRAVASIVGGLFGGYLLYDYNRPAAAGLSVGMVGLGLANLIGNWAKVPVSFAEYEQAEYEEYEQASDQDLLGLGYDNGLSDAVVDQETLLSGLNAGPADEDLFGIEDAEIRTVQPYELTSLF